MQCYIHIYTHDVHNVSSRFVMPHRSQTSLSKHYARIYKTLGRAELQRGAPDLDDLDLEGLIHNKNGLMFNFYTQEGVEFALKQYGLYDDIREQGYESLRLELRQDDQDDWLLRIHSTVPMMQEPLVELVMRRSVFNLHNELREQLGNDVFSVLSVEWLQLQHPMASFSPTRPPLPGQHMPGLGLARQIFGLLRNMCRRLKLDGLVTTPSYYHNAIFYEVGFSFFDPQYHGYLQAMKRDFHTLYKEHFSKADCELELAISSWATHWGHVMAYYDDDSKERLDWFHEPMIAPLTPKLKRYIHGEWFHNEVKKTAESVRYEWLESALTLKLAEVGLLPHDCKKIESFLQEEAL